MSSIDPSFFFDFLNFFNFAKPLRHRSQLLDEIPDHFIDQGSDSVLVTHSKHHIIVLILDHPINY